MLNKQNRFKFLAYKASNRSKKEKKNFAWNNGKRSNLFQTNRLVMYCAEHRTMSYVIIGACDYSLTSC